MTEIPRIDIPEDVMNLIQENANNKMVRYLWESIIPGAVVKFYNTDVRIYIQDPDRDPDTEPVADIPDNNSQIPETIVYNKEQYKVAAVFNWVAAKTLAKAIRGFSITPFNY